MRRIAIEWEEERDEINVHTVTLGNQRYECVLFRREFVIRMRNENKT